MRRRWSRWAIWLPGLLVASCASPLPPGWVYVTQVGRSAATVAWTGTAGGSAVCRGAGGQVRPAPAVRGARGLLMAQVEGLGPDRRYFCRVLDADGHPVRRITFRTAPDGNTPFLFTAVGDTGHGGSVARAIARRIRAAHPAFLVHLGDLAYGSGTSEDLARYFFPPYRDTLPYVPLFPTPGNHDLERRSAYRVVFAPVATGATGDGLRYTFDWGPAFFASFSPDDGAAGAPGLAAELAAARARSWRIAFTHEPLYTGGGKRTTRRLRRSLAPVLEQGGVDLVLAGHQHFYERSEPSCEYVPTARVHHVTSGGGSRTNLNPVKPHPNFPFALAEAHFLRVRVSPDRIDIRAVSPEGHTLDRTRIARGVDDGCRRDGWKAPRPR